MQSTVSQKGKGVYNANTMPPENDHAEMKRLMEQNTALLKENNELLNKIHRNALIAFWVRIVWYAALIGLPFALYFYLLEPYFTAMGSSYDTFIQGLNELPGFRGIDQLMQKYNQ